MSENYLSVQLLALPTPRVGECWICEEPEVVIVAADNATRGFVCLGCSGSAIELERFLARKGSSFGWRHPHGYENHSRD
tara:strand:- start:795 stop:1031 length:237 start_codon:yes stop_codon:yes gene_type:complete